MAGKKGGNTIAKAYELAKPIADGLSLKIWDILFEKEGAYWYLKVLLDKEGDSLSMDDCEAFTRPMSKALDDADPIEQNYILEVGSPGLGRSLRTKEHFLEYIECPLKIRYIRENDGVKEFIAILKEYKDDTITVETENGIKDVKLSETAFVRLYDDEDIFDEE